MQNHAKNQEVDAVVANLSDQRFEGALKRLAVPLLFSVALVLVLMHAFVRTEEFIHRSDDAFYYFKVAANFPHVGFWSFDTVHSTNGVQPLWAVILTLLAQALSWVGISDPDLLARLFVGLTAALHFASCLVLYHLLARKVSVGTAVVAAGAFLFPLGLVWGRVWGMENSLYALLLLSTVTYFHLDFLKRGTVRHATLLGLLLGLTALARLNAVLFIACLLGYYLLTAAHGSWKRRLHLAVVAGAVAGALLLPYFLANLAATSHLLPISGAAKWVATEQFLADRGIESRFSLDYARLLFTEFTAPAQWFITSRLADGLWVVGARLIFDGAVGLRLLLPVLSLFVLAPLALGRPLEWLRFLSDRLGRLLPFSYLLMFGLLNAIISAFQYPLEIRYAMIRWWLVENEIVIIVLVATLVVACVSYLGQRLLPPHARAIMAVAALAVLVTFHAWLAVQFYWDDSVQTHDWNLSWNDESYLAAQWLAANTPEDTLVGSWNAGVLGHYSGRRVVNLDGLVNNFELLPYLENETIGDYIKQERLRYVSDLDPMFEHHDLTEQIELTEVYSHYNEHRREHYRIYRVDE